MLIHTYTGFGYSSIECVNSHQYTGQTLEVDLYIEGKTRTVVA